MAKIISCFIIVVYLFLINGSVNQSNINNDKKNVIIEASFSETIKEVINDIENFFIKIFSRDNQKPVPQKNEEDEMDTVKVVYSNNNDMGPEINGEAGGVVDDNPVEVDPYTKFRNDLQVTYFSQVGIREKTGHNDGKEVEAYLASAGLERGNAWCASFVNWIFIQNGANLPIVSKGWVPSYFPKKKTIYVRGQYKKMEPKYGDLIGIWFEDKGRLAHIGFYDHEDESYYYSVEGNTNTAGSREGDGVYVKKRIKRQVHSISNWVD